MSLDPSHAERAKRSNVWQFCSLLNPTLAMCNLCKMNIKYHRTHNLKNHLKTAHGITVVKVQKSSQGPQISWFTVIYKKAKMLPFSPHHTPCPSRKLWMAVHTLGPRHYHTHRLVPSTGALLRARSKGSNGQRTGNKNGMISAHRYRSLASPAHTTHAAIALRLWSFSRNS